MGNVLFPDGDGIFQDDVLIDTAYVATSVSRFQYCYALVVRLGEPLVRNRFPPPSCLKEVEQVLMEELLKIPLDEVYRSLSQVIYMIT